MSDLSKARQQIGQIRTMLKQGKVQPAVQALHSNLVTILKTPLMKSERDEFENMVDDAVFVLATDAEIKRIYPNEINYVRGEERELLEVLREILSTFDSSILDAANEALRMQEERKRQALIDAENAYNAGDEQKCREILNRMAREYREDAKYLGEIGTVCIKLTMYDDAVAHLERALELDPELVYLYNQIGIALRKVGKYDVAEKYYLKASQYLTRDPNLFFNLGRVYVDWKKWKKAIAAANGSLKLEPTFVEAQKLLKYAEKKLKEQEEGNV